MADLVVCVGDSLTVGSCSESGTPWHQRVTNRLASEWRAYAVGGASLNVISAATLAGYGSGYTEKVAILWAGTNPISAGSQTGAQFFTDYDAYRATLQASGWLVVGCLLQDMPTNDTEAQAFNTLLSGSTDFDAVADLRTPLPDCTDTTKYYSDQIHLLDVGYALVATAIQTAMATL